MIASSPHQVANVSVGQIMRQVCYALVPGILAYSWFFGPGILVHILLAITAACVTEALTMILRKRSVTAALADGSAILTALLLALAIPAIAPWWVTVLGSAFAIMFGKQLYGGLGYNPFNPAMLGYAMLLISFPLEMTRWPAAYPLLTDTPTLRDSISIIFSHGVTLDAISAATPLDTLKTQLGRGVELSSTLGNPEFSQLFGHFAGTGWEWVSLAFLLGGLYLLLTKRIAWQIPFSLLITLAILSSIFYWIDPEHYLPPWLHLLGGASMLGAFFIATDPVSACTSARGRLYYGAGIAIITFTIRTWGGYPEGLAFAVLIMNMAAPTIDHYTQPRVFGGS